MDDFLVFSSSFQSCLSNIGMVLQRCDETNLVLIQEKCHFMVQEGMVFRHKISINGTQVDKVNIQVIEKLHPPTSDQGVHSFLHHAWFYKKFVKDFSKITKPLLAYLKRIHHLTFSYECLTSFNTLKEKLISTLIIATPNWRLPFKLMCDASD